MAPRLVRFPACIGAAFGYAVGRAGIAEEADQGRTAFAGQVIIGHAGIVARVELP